MLRNHAKSRWAKLTDGDIDNIAGKRSILLGKLQARCGVLKDEAEEQVDTWITRFDLPKGETKTSDAKDKDAS